MHLKSIVSKTITIYQKAFKKASLAVPNIENVKNELTRTPAKDCFSSTSSIIEKKLPQIKNKENLKTYLKHLKESDKTSRLNPNEINRVISSADTPEKAKFKFNLAIKLAKLQDKSGNKMYSEDLRKILTISDTVEKAQLAEKLSFLKNKNGNTLLEAYDLRRIVSSASTPQKAAFKLDLTKNLAKLADKKGNAKLNSYDLRIITASVDTTEKARLIEKLARLEKINGNALLSAEDLRQISHFADTPQKIELAEKYFKMQINKGNYGTNVIGFGEIVSSRENINEFIQSFA